MSVAVQHPRNLGAFGVRLASRNLPVRYELLDVDLDGGRPEMPERLVDPQSRFVAPRPEES